MTPEPEPQSCFLSYSHRDAEFAERLVADLTSVGVRITQDRHDFLPGDSIDHSLFGPGGAIHEADRVLVACSRNSLAVGNTAWIDRELSAALAKERAQLQRTGEKSSVIIPLDLDGFLFSPECDYYRRQDLRDRVVARFDGPGGYAAGRDRLVEALRKAPPPRDPAPPDPVPPKPGPPAAVKAVAAFLVIAAVMFGVRAIATSDDPPPATPTPVPTTTQEPNEMPTQVPPGGMVTCEVTPEQIAEVYVRSGVDCGWGFWWGDNPGKGLSFTADELASAFATCSGEPAGIRVEVEFSNDDTKAFDFVGKSDTFPVDGEVSVIRYRFERGLEVPSKGQIFACDGYLLDDRFVLSGKSEAVVETANG